MDKFKFKKLIENHSKEIEKGLLEIERLDDIEEKGRGISLFWWKHSEKKKKLLKEKPESLLLGYDPDLVKYEELIDKLWKSSCELGKEVIKQRKNRKKDASKEKKNKVDLSKKKKSQKQNNLCWECHKIKSEKWFTNKETGLEFCSQVCNLEHNAELCENCVQKCLKYENGIAVDSQSFYKDNEKKTGTLCFPCKQKQIKDLESELDRLEKEQEIDKEELEKIKDLIENNNSSKDNNISIPSNPININNSHYIKDIKRERERERERESKFNLNNNNYFQKSCN